MIVVFKYAIVFHDLEKCLGAVQHTMPFLMMWQIHWNMRGTPSREQWGFYNPELIELNLKTIGEYYLNFYIYYFGMFSVVFYAIAILFWNKIESGYAFFSYDLLTTNGYLKKDHTRTELIYGYMYYTKRHTAAFTAYITVILP